MRAPTLTALAIVGFAALLAMALPAGAEPLTRKASWLAIAHRVDCDVDHAFTAEATIAAVCRDGRVVPFYAELPCSETALCAMGVPLTCWEPSAALAMPRHLSDAQRRARLP